MDYPPAVNTTPEAVLWHFLLCEFRTKAGVYFTRCRSERAFSNREFPGHGVDPVLGLGISRRARSDQKCSRPKFLTNRAFADTAGSPKRSVVPELVYAARNGSGESNRPDSASIPVGQRTACRMRNSRSNTEPSMSLLPFLDVGFSVDGTE